MNVKQYDSSSRVAYQGEPGAHSEAAAFQAFGAAITTVPCETFAEIYEKISTGAADYGMAPIENSLVGSIHQNYDLLLKWRLPVVGELNYRVSHALLGPRGASLEGINKVYSHPVALEQCREFFEAHPKIKPILWNDTAGAVRMVAESAKINIAAIAGRQAAELYGMDVLQEELEDQPTNYTRFLIIGREPEPFEGTCKTSVVFSLKNEAGALFKCLSVFALRDISLTKIESRPMRQEGWQYYFYVDFADSAHSDRGAKALDHLREICAFVRVLGTYPSDLTFASHAH
ncbi:MAG TPA: prephenate dehydratase [candidate division Zixibacteria bacterium]|nr:prephenate dehydratase [candidate division Zixibacteria bacterium]